MEKQRIKERVPQITSCNTSKRDIFGESDKVTDSKKCVNDEKLAVSFW